MALSYIHRSTKADLRDCVTLFEQTYSFVTEPTDIPGVVYAIASRSGMDDLEGFIEVSVLQRAKTFETAVELLQREAWYAFAPSGVEKLFKPLSASDADMTQDDLLPAQTARATDLYRDRRFYDGFVYRYGRALPVSTPPVVDSICASSVDLSPELRAALEAHPAVTILKEDYVRHNGTTWHLSLQFTEEQWETMFALATAEKDKHFCTGSIFMRVVMYGIYMQPEARRAAAWDILGLYSLLEPASSGSGYDDW
jgi:hypothetical protein